MAVAVAIAVVGCLLDATLTYPAAAQPPEVQADEGPVEGATRTRVAVLLLPARGVDPTIADELGELLIGLMAARGGLTLVGRQEFEAQLGQSGDSALDCIGSIPCLGRVGVQLNVVEAVVGTLARQNESWVFNLNRLDLRTGRAVGRVFREVEGDLEALVEALDEALPQLYVPLGDAPEPEAGAAENEAGENLSASLLLQLDAADVRVFVDGREIQVVDGANGTAAHARAEGLSPGQHRVVVHHRQRETWSRSPMLSAEHQTTLRVSMGNRRGNLLSPLGISGALVVLSALSVAIPLGLLSGRQIDDLATSAREGTITRAGALSYYSAREREAIAANVIAPLSLVGAAMMIWAWALPGPGGSAEEELELSFSPFGVAIGGRF